MNYIDGKGAGAWARPNMLRDMVSGQAPPIKGYQSGSTGRSFGKRRRRMS